jgi:hypothetical protein
LSDATGYEHCKIRWFEAAYQLQWIGTHVVNRSDVITHYPPLVVARSRCAED